MTQETSPETNIMTSNIMNLSINELIIARNIINVGSAETDEEILRTNFINFLIKMDEVYGYANLKKTLAKKGLGHISEKLMRSMVSATLNKQNKAVPTKDITLTDMQSKVLDAIIERISVSATGENITSSMLVSGDLTIFQIGGVLSTLADKGFISVTKIAGISKKVITLK